LKENDQWNSESNGSEKKSHENYQETWHNQNKMLSEEIVIACWEMEDINNTP
jgi:hypothetical protein